ncbi:MAG: transcriptional repressor [Candidatus Fermentibacteraceae bacterium]|nr:transcriptional repressor [Candidatus Fermentibacteraceae bacterium]MBN2609551.1 transcriptional repressor [Candidatus Fermentibacteraceae bacterium]
MDTRKELDPLRRALRSADIRMTQQRIEVYLEVVRSSGHPSVAEIFQEIRKKLPSITLDTVYRTLWKLSELGLISPLTSSGGGVRFDPRIEHHHHFTCAKCSRTFDFHSGALDEIPIPRAASDLGQVWDAHMEVRGICSACSKKTLTEADHSGKTKGEKR